MRSPLSEIWKLIAHIWYCRLFRSCGCDADKAEIASLYSVHAVYAIALVHKTIFMHFVLWHLDGLASWSDVCQCLCAAHNVCEHPEAYLEQWAAASATGEPCIPHSSTKASQLCLRHRTLHTLSRVPPNLWLDVSVAWCHQRSTALKKRKTVTVVLGESQGSAERVRPRQVVQSPNCPTPTSYRSSNASKLCPSRPRVCSEAGLLMSRCGYKNLHGLKRRSPGS